MNLFYKISFWVANFEFFFSSSYLHIPVCNCGNILNRKEKARDSLSIHLFSHIQPCYNVAVWMYIFDWIGFPHLNKLRNIHTVITMLPSLCLQGHLHVLTLWTCTLQPHWAFSHPMCCGLCLKCSFPCFHMANSNPGLKLSTQISLLRGFSWPTSLSQVLCWHFIIFLVMFIIKCFLCICLVESHHFMLSQGRKNICFVYNCKITA